MSQEAIPNEAEAAALNLLAEQDHPWLRKAVLRMASRIGDPRHIENRLTVAALPDDIVLLRAWLVDLAASGARFFHRLDRVDFRGAMAHARKWREDLLAAERKVVSPGIRMGAVKPPDAYFVVEHHGAFRVVGGPSHDRPAGPTWQSADREEAEQVARFLVQYSSAYYRWEATSIRAEYCPSPDFRIKVGKGAGGDMAHAHLFARDGRGWRRVGGYGFKLARWTGCMAIGEFVVAGGASLSKGFIGQGYGAMLYEAAIKTSGMPAVPHGLNGVEGGRTDCSIAFWRKRALLDRVPGYGDPDVASRAELLLRGEQGSILEQHFDRVAPLIARDAGGVAMCCRYSDGNLTYSMGRWVRLPDGRCLGMTAIGLDVASEEDIVATIHAQIPSHLVEVGQDVYIPEDGEVEHLTEEYAEVANEISERYADVLVSGPRGP